MRYLTQSRVLLQRATLRPQLSTQTFRYASSASEIIEEPKFDQTKHSNDPDKSIKQDHKDEANLPEDSPKRDHPAKQPSHQPTPSKATGFEKEGPDGVKAGEGRDRGVTEDRGAGPHMKQ